MDPGIDKDVTIYSSMLVDSAPVDCLLLEGKSYDFPHCTLFCNTKMDHKISFG